jgi:L-iditol 2-dehydrogenase
LQKAKEFGADEVRRGDQNLNLKAERVIVCTGAYAAVEQAFRCIDKKGIILLFAIPNRDIAIPIPDFWRNELTVTSSYGAAPVDLAAALSLIADKTINVKDTITQTLPLTQIQAAFKIVAEAKESLKVVLEVN